MFRLFSSWPATSRATFGLASKFAPTVPIGIRRSLTWSPFGSVHESISRSSGGDRRHRFDLLRERLHPLVVEPEPVEHPLVEAAGRCLVVGGIRSEDLGATLANEGSSRDESFGHGAVGEPCCRAACLERLALHGGAEPVLIHPLTLEGVSCQPTIRPAIRSATAAIVSDGFGPIGPGITEPSAT